MSLFSAASSSGNFTNPTKGSSRPSNPNSTYVGIVTRVVGSQVIVRIPKLNASAEFGPCDVYCEFPSVGDFVLCGYVDNRYEHIVVAAKKHNPVENESSIIENRVFDNG
jgi:hypothetical protein